MAQTGFIVYDDETGEPVGWGRCDERDVILQAPPFSGRTPISVPVDTVVITDVEMAGVRATLEAQLDATAAAILAPGRNPIYARKLAEAQAGHGPMIEAEAVALNISIADLADTIIEKAAQFSALEVRVETARRLAKEAMRAAPNIGKAHQAVASVDWETIIGEAD